MFQINWKLKALLYKIFIFFNLKKIFYLTQKYITKRSRINFRVISENWINHAENVEKFECKNILEIGAGKSLEQNIYLAYLFNGEVNQTAIDINQMLDFELFNDASKKISNLINKKYKGSIKNLDDLSVKYNIQYKAPFSLDELVNTGVKFDMCISTTTLEHFSVEDLKVFLKKIDIVLKGKQLISSVIDYSDHYAHTDNKITKLNFLKFNETTWEKYNNKYLFQNRLRHQDYRNLFRDYNFNIIKEKKGDMLERIENLSNEFDIKNEETFLSWGYYLISRKNHTI